MRKNGARHRITQATPVPGLDVIRRTQYVTGLCPVFGSAGSFWGVALFKKYHIVILKDREGGISNLRLPGWMAPALFLLVAGLAGLNMYLWGFYTRSTALEYELSETRRTLQASDTRLLHLTGRVAELQEALNRVMRFDAKLRVLMNIGGTDTAEAGDEARASHGAEAGPLLARHRELFTRRSFSLVEELMEQALLEEVKQQSLVLFMRENKELLLATPSIWPCRGFVTSGFGRRSSPFTGQSRMHTGIDISNRPGTPVMAPARGTVTFSGSDGAYGISIVINHGNNLVTKYAHLQRTLVREGQQVQREDVIGTLGNTGRSTGPHLHYEVRVGGMPVDPTRYILN